MLTFLKKLPWRDIILVGILILIDISIHPLTAGPDRLVHDPAVYRLVDANYMPGDWYTDMAVKSQVYIFYAKLVNAWQFFGIPEELWRSLLYLVSLAVLYYALIRIARLFSKSVFVVPILVILHAMISTGDNQPIWLYGPFVQIDGGLAPRSIGTAVSFLALFLLLRGSPIVASALLGLATLVHVSNSLIVFTLFFVVWLGLTILTNKNFKRQPWLEIARKAGLALGAYIVFGGWFAFYVASLGSSGAPEFTTEKFIWAWIYLRAPYMALPLVTKYWWIRLFAHVIAIVVGWFLLRKRVELGSQRAIDILTLIGLGSVVYFFLFYFFAFVWPWLPGFQFYSIRVVYLAYFVAYLFISLSLLIIGRELIVEVFLRLGINAKRYASAIVVLSAIVFLAGFGWRLGDTFHKPKLQNIHTSWRRLLDDNVMFRIPVPEDDRKRLPQQATLQYLILYPQPFLAPPDWRTSGYYLPNIVSFKSFGFTIEGLPQWFTRLNDVSRGEIQKIYETQMQSGHMERVSLNWTNMYAGLTENEILALSRKYNFKLFVTSRNNSYPFTLITEDGEFRLYKLPE